MIHINNQEQHEPKLEPRPYPYIGIYHSTGANKGHVTYVKFIRPNYGHLIHTTREGISEYHTEWEERYYKVMQGSLTISNEPIVENKVCADCCSLQRSRQNSRLLKYSKITIK